MTHANRGAAKLGTNPKPDELRRLRELYGLTLDQAAALALSTHRSWHDWELGYRRCHPAIWRWVLIQLDVGPALAQSRALFNPQLHEARTRAQGVVDVINSKLNRGAKS